MMLGRVFTKPQKPKIFYEALMKEIEDLGIKSLGIIMFISFFIGGVIALQTALNLDSPFIPDSLIGFAAKRSIILEFAPTFCSIILAGKVGSYITSSIGTMRVTEQIDALEVMGINSINFLVLPKVIAALFFYPFFNCCSHGFRYFWWMASRSSFGFIYRYRLYYRHTNRF